MVKCPRDGECLASVEVFIAIRGTMETNRFDGYLCGKCRIIWSETEVSGAIDLTKLI